MFHFAQPFSKHYSSMIGLLSEGAMLVQLLNPEIRSFGVNDHPLCPQCGRHMNLTRRGSNNPFDLSAEFQTFACIECDYEATRIVDTKAKGA
jgi:hypothetical protein